MKNWMILFCFCFAFLANAQSIFDLNEKLGRGVNFGNALEAPSEGAWGMMLEPKFFELVKEAGFSSIRLPVSWTYHAAKDAPYTIDTEFMDRVQWAVDEALSQGLNIIVNDHHHDELNTDPVAETARFEAIWQQIGEKFKDYPETLYFELLNEPHDTFNTKPELWNQIVASTLKVLRVSNPTRAVIVGPVNYNSTTSLARLELPDDPNLIVTVHFYEPFAFTHQGAEWITPSPPTGVLWTGGNRRLSPRWQNQSKDTMLSFVKEGLDEYWQVSFNSPESYVQLHSILGPRGYDQVVLKANADAHLSISCNLEGDTFKNVILKANEELSIPFLDCGNPTALKDLVLKNDSGEAQTFLLDTLELRGERGILSPFDDEGTALRETLSKAFEWGQDEGRPIFLGEFGAYSKADPESRLRWTSFIRHESEKLGFSWAYWEFGAGFGIYDRDNHVWRQALLYALMKD